MSVAPDTQQPDGPLDYPPGPIPPYRRRRPASIGVSLTSLGLICGLVAGVAVTLAWGWLNTASLEITTTGSDGSTTSYLTTWHQNQTPVQVAGLMDHQDLSVHPLGQLVQVNVSGSGSVSCEIKIDGKVRKSTSGTGTASCGIRLFPWTV